MKTFSQRPLNQQTNCVIAFFTFSKCTIVVAKETHKDPFEMTLCNSWTFFSCNPVHNDVNEGIAVALGRTTRCPATFEQSWLADSIT